MRRGRRRRTARTRLSSGPPRRPRVGWPSAVTVIYDGVIGPWFLDAFSDATGLPLLHYAILLPPERLCLDRVASRVGHGFTDFDAGAHMYADFAQADIDSRHVITNLDTADAQAAHPYELVRHESIVRPVERKSGNRAVP